MNKKYFITVLILLITFISYAQKGIIRGKVNDKKTGEELIGTTIIAVGTQMGAITDFDGNYSLELPVGKYEIKCSFISYETITITNVEIKTDEIQSINFQLGEASIVLQEVRIEARQMRKTENALLAMQKVSTSVINGISAQEISKAGDNNAAAALKRVIGISVEDGKYVYVRGLSDRYSKTTLNGAEIPGLDPNRNTVQMDMFPSNLIENMVVFKTFSPELPGSFAGGYINIVTKDFPEKFTFQFSSSFAYNDQSSFNKNFLTYDGGKLDWLGIDDGTRNWPINNTKEIPSLYVDNDKLDNITRSFNNEMDTKHKKSFMNQSYSISLGNQKNIGEKSLGYIVGINYQKNYEYFNDGATGRYKLTGFEENSLNTERFLNTEKGAMEVLSGGMLSLNYKLSRKHKIGIAGIHNRSGVTSAKFLDGKKPSDEIGMYQQNRELKFLERSITSGQLKGEHYLENFKKLKINWLSSYTVSKQNEPDLRYFVNSYYIENNDTTFEIEKSKYALPARYSREMKESNFDNKIDFSIPVFIPFKSKLKFGFANVYKYRVFEEERIDINSQNNSFTASISEYFNDNNIGQNAQGTYGVYMIDATDTKNSYTGKQDVAAAYALIDVNFNKKLRMTVGGRLEYTNIHIESYNKKKADGNLENLDFLPVLNFTYEIVEDLFIRTATSRTLARPTFRELAPYASYDYETGETKLGNNNLERTLIDNFDIRTEYFIKPGEIISISGFYKRFINPIETTFNPIASNPELTWKNVEKANVYGIEFEFRKNLDFINILRDFKIGLNMSYIKSVVSIDSLELLAIQGTNPNHADTRVMFGQSPYIVNAILSYKNDSIGLSANISYNIAGEKLAVVIVSGTPNIYEQPFNSLNFNINQKIGKRFSLKFSAKNILNSIHEKIYTYNSKEYIYDKYSVGRTYSLG
ncbi:MAG: TonB-dependent receptor, partial [Bacteroidota bacterium]|nr:TonB-dependent receptor [Bacteroidota bacterium]